MTWPSPASTARSRWRTARIVVLWNIKFSDCIGPAIRVSRKRDARCCSTDDAGRAIRVVAGAIFRRFCGRARLAGGLLRDVDSRSWHRQISCAHAGEDAVSHDTRLPTIISGALTIGRGPGARAWPGAARLSVVQRRRRRHSGSARRRQAERAVAGAAGRASASAAATAAGSARRQCTRSGARALSSSGAARAGARQPEPTAAPGRRSGRAQRTAVPASVRVDGYRCTGRLPIPRLRLPPWGYGRLPLRRL